MIPFSDDNPVRITAFVNWLLIGLCVAVFLVELVQGGANGAWLQSLGFMPAMVLHGKGVQALIPAYPAWLTIFTSMFLHGGFLHLGGNMLYLWVFGNNIEEAMGHGRYLLFYLLSGIAAALTMVLITPFSLFPMVGASGAISGVLGAYVLLYPRARVRVIVPLGIIPFPLRVGAMWVVGFWFVLQLGGALFSDTGQPGTAWWAHLGGFAAGAVMTPFLKSSHVSLFGDVRRGPWD